MRFTTGSPNEIGRDKLLYSIFFSLPLRTAAATVPVVAANFRFFSPLLSIMEEIVSKY